MRGGVAVAFLCATLPSMDGRNLEFHGWQAPLVIASDEMYLLSMKISNPSYLWTAESTNVVPLLCFFNGPSNDWTIRNFHSRIATNTFISS